MTLPAALFLLAKRGWKGALAEAAARPLIFNVADGHPISQRACYEWLAGRLQRPVPPMSIAATRRRRGNSNKRVSSARLQALGWSPRYPTFETRDGE